MPDKNGIDRCCLTSRTFDHGVGDVRDVHRYDAPGPEADRAVVLGEFGALGLEIEGHMWKESPNFRRFGYRCFDTRRELTDAYVELLRDLRPSVRRAWPAPSTRRPPTSRPKSTVC